MRILITGATGVIGRHLAHHFLASDETAEVWAFKRWRSNTEGLAHLGLSAHPRFHILEGDVTDPGSIRRAVETARPDIVHHLAAQSFPSASWDAPVHTMQVNLEGTVNLLEALRALRVEPTVHIAGSSAQYGSVRPDEVPIRESQPFRPLSPYGVSKVAAELLGFQYWETFRIPVVVTRSFNHVGLGQDSRTAVQTFCRQVARVEAGVQEPVIMVGNLTPRRDFSDVRDAVRALALLVERGHPGEAYNVGSGMAVAVKDVLAMVLGMTKVRVEVRQDPTRMRPVDEPILCADTSKLRAATGWTPRVSLEATVGSVLQYWRDIERSAARHA